MKKSIYILLFLPFLVAADVRSTAIGGGYYHVCCDATGQEISKHTRLDKATVSATNYAIKNNIKVIIRHDFVLEIVSDSLVKAPTPASQPPETAVMYSYNADLSGAKPLDSATLDHKQAFFFWVNAGKYSVINYYCCKGISGQSAGIPHNDSVESIISPFVYSVDLTNEKGGVRELYTDSVHAAGYDSQAINFTLPDIVAINGSAILSWSPPATRTDGSVLAESEVAGYRVFKGSSSDNLQQLAEVNALTYIVTGLPVGTHYFGIKTKDFGGRVSGMSNVESKIIP